MPYDPIILVEETAKVVTQYLGEKGGIKDVEPFLLRRLSVLHAKNPLSQSDMDEEICYLIDRLLAIGVIETDEEDYETEGFVARLSPLGWQMFEQREAHPYAEMLEHKSAIIKLDYEHQDDEEVEAHDPERAKLLLKKILGEQHGNFGLYLEEYGKWSPKFSVDGVALVFRQGDSPKDDVFITSCTPEHRANLSDVHIVRDMKSLARVISFHKQEIGCPCPAHP
jgi:hypothetical protein